MTTPEEMYKKLMFITELINDTGLRTNIQKYLNSHKDKISVYPASIGYHHNERYGSIRHTLEVCQLCKELAQSVYGLYMIEIDNDTLFASAVLHDIGKIFRYTEKENGEFEYVKTAIDHAMAVIIDYKRLSGTSLPWKVELTILSHEGGWAKHGVSPETLEAAILAAADLVSSRLERREWVI